VEFLRAQSVTANRIYVYDGAKIEPQYYGWNMENIRGNASYGTESNPKVWVMYEIPNSKENKLGMPLPAGSLRFYRRDTNGQLEFTGEDHIDHTPKNETLRVYTGNAFDIVGERLRTNFQSDPRGHWVDESFEIKVRNHKTSTVNLRVVEHLYRWTQWEITSKPSAYAKKDAQTIEFRVPIAADGETTINYTVHYSW
jgi:hypothetical protein